MHADSNPTTPRKPVNHALLGLIQLVTSAAAGFAGWSIGERTRDFARVPIEISSKAYQFAELNAATLKVNSINGAIVYGGFGLCLAIAASLAGMLVASGQKPRLFVVLAAVVAAAALSGLPSFLMMPMSAASADADPGSLDLTTPLLIHLGLWCPIGAGIGLVCGLMHGEDRKSIAERVVAGIVGAALGTVVYEFAGAISMPTGKTNEPLPGTESARLAAMLCVALGIGLAMVRVNLRPKKPAITPALADPSA